MQERGGRRVSCRMMLVALIFEDVLRLICGCALQSGGNKEEEESFYDEVKGKWDMHSAGS